MTKVMEKAEARLKRKLKQGSLHYEASKIFYRLFQLGYVNPNLVRELWGKYYPKYINDKDSVLAFRNFWNGNVRPPEMCDELNIIFAKTLTKLELDKIEDSL